jgi:predicted nuclease of predicted toxin-antitoxin system
VIRWLADENFNGKILRALRRELPDIDLIRVQDTALLQAPDPQVLAWAAQESRLLLTQDVETMVGFANARVAQGLPMSGVIVLRHTLRLSTAIDDILTIASASDIGDWANRVVFLPL